MTEVDEKYLNKLITSLTEDIDKWTIKHCGGGPGVTWTEYHSPKYGHKTENGELQFEIGYHRGCYIDGGIGWRIPLMNPFSKLRRDLKRATRKMKSHVNHKESVSRKIELEKKIKPFT